MHIDRWKRHLESAATSADTVVLGSINTGQGMVLHVTCADPGHLIQIAHSLISQSMEMLLNTKDPLEFGPMIDCLEEVLEILPNPMDDDDGDDD